jgi:hypothetical protein
MHRSSRTGNPVLCQLAHKVAPLWPAMALSAGSPEAGAVAVAVEAPTLLVQLAVPVPQGPLQQQQQVAASRTNNMYE